MQLDVAFSANIQEFQPCGAIVRDIFNILDDRLLPESAPFALVSHANEVVVTRQTDLVNLWSSTLPFPADCIFPIPSHPSDDRELFVVYEDSSRTLRVLERNSMHSGPVLSSVRLNISPQFVPDTCGGLSSWFSFSDGSSLRVLEVGDNLCLRDVVSPLRYPSIGSLDRRLKSFCWDRWGKSVCFALENFEISICYFERNFVELVQSRQGSPDETEFQRWTRPLLYASFGTVLCLVADPLADASWFGTASRCRDFGDHISITKGSLPSDESLSVVVDGRSAVAEELEEEGETTPPSGSLFSIDAEELDGVKSVGASEAPALSQSGNRVQIGALSIPASMQSLFLRDDVEEEGETKPETTPVFSSNVVASGLQGRVQFGALSIPASMRSLFSAEDGSEEEGETGSVCSTGASLGPEGRLQVGALSIPPSMRSLFSEESSSLTGGLPRSPEVGPRRNHRNDGLVVSNLRPVFVPGSLRLLDLYPEESSRFSDKRKPGLLFRVSLSPVEDSEETATLALSPVSTVPVMKPDVLLYDPSGDGFLVTTRLPTREGVFFLSQSHSNLVWNGVEEGEKIVGFRSSLREGRSRFVLLLARRVPQGAGFFFYEYAVRMSRFRQVELCDVPQKQEIEEDTGRGGRGRLARVEQLVIENSTRLQRIEERIDQQNALLQLILNKFE